VSIPPSSPLVVKGQSSEDVWDHENAFYWFSPRTRINKLLAHFELYKQIINLPGDIYEFGVYKAASIIRLATFRDVLENDYSRKIVGFDAFGKFPTSHLTLESDLKFVQHFEDEGGDGISLEDANAIIARKGFENIELIAGDVFETLPKYVEINPSARIAFLHLDMDVKEPSAFALEEMYDRVVPNGLIVFDDYNAVAGESDVVDSFISKKKLRIEKTSHYAIPSYVRKPM
jgi:Macrocin-O-methyltransferase (TylF)